MLVLGNGKVITRDAACPLIENGAVAIDGTTICKVSSTEDIKNAYPEAEYIGRQRRPDHAPALLMYMSIFTVRLQEVFP